MDFTNHGVVTIVNGKVTRLRDIKNENKSIVDNGDVAHVMTRLFAEGWQLKGNYELQIERQEPAIMPPSIKDKDNLDSCAVKVDGTGTFEDNVARIKKTFADQGWTFVELVRPLNDSPTLLFSRPKAGK
jgi:hypothetical protein